MGESMTSFAKRLKEARDAKGIGQRELAEKAGMVGGQSISNMERGRNGAPKLANFLRLADALGCDPFWLFPEWNEDSGAVPGAADSNGSGEPGLGAWVEALLEADGIVSVEERAKASGEIRKIANGDEAEITPAIVRLAARVVIAERPAPPPTVPKDYPSDSPPVITRRRKGPRSRRAR